ncbi:polysaccharide biosynthesis/export family protein [candidate division KSB1 bacterium]|nr:polysaccharide export protein [bacterium]NUM65114.1 polysaccharide biosynthesis/export family protein [candidate division KSB1 bacterium]
MSYFERDFKQMLHMRIPGEVEGCRWGGHHRVWAPILLLALALSELSLTGCASTPSTRVAASPGLRSSATLPAYRDRVAITGVASAPPEYRINILDELEIKTRYHERLNEIAKVRPDGRITLEAVGDLYVVGRTPSQVDSLITAAYAEIVHAPEVTVYVRNFAGLAVYVLGEVDKPGQLELLPNMTVLQALAAAGGPIRGAKMNSVIVLRPDQAGELTGVRVDLARPALAAAAHQDLYLQPQDVVYVPKTFIANVNEFLTQVYDGLFPPFDIYLRALREYNRPR